MASENAIPSPESSDSRSHTITRQANTGHENSGRIGATDAVDQGTNSESDLNVQVVTTEPTSSGAADQIVSEDARQANSDGTEVETIAFRHSDVVDQNLDHENVDLNGALVPGLTRKDSPPSYERVVRENSTFVTIQASTVEEVPTTVTTTDNDTVTDIDVITTQPQSSSIVDSPVVVDRENTSESSRDIMSDSDPELTATIDYLRRRRRERGNVDETECYDNLRLCFGCTVCDVCAPSGNNNNNCDDVVMTQPLSSSTINQPAFDANRVPDVASQSAPEQEDSITGRLNHHEHNPGCTGCTCDNDCCQFCSYLCDESCFCSDEMICFCEVS
jgi:hypothetical protein